MSQTLYRKYRPQKFVEIAGQEHVISTLKNEILNNRLAHAYLFTGPRGIGKTSTARLLSKAVNCEKKKEKEAEPCNTCQSCQDITLGQSLDMIEIDAASHTQVDHVRESIIPNARTAPTKNKYKIFIIDEVHMLSISAFNALLKILEEPPKHVIFILATTEVHKLPETIISRCQRFDFKRVPVKEIMARLKKIADQEKIKVDEKVLSQIAILCEGSIRDAEGILGQVFCLGEKKITPEVAELVLPRSDFKLIFSLFGYLIEKDTPKSIRLVNTLVEEGVDLRFFVDQFIDFLRKLLLIKVDKKLEVFSYFEVDPNSEKKFEQFVKKAEIKTVRDMISVFIKVRREINHVSISQLPLELAVLEFTSGRMDEREETDVNSSPPTSGIDEETSPKKPEINKNIDNIKQKWPAIIKSLNGNNHALALILKNCLPVGFSKGTLIIGCNFKFHKERLNEKGNFEKIRETIRKTINKEINIELVVEKVKIEPPKEKKKEPENAESKNMLYSDVLKTFGGEIVET